VADAPTPTHGSADAQAAKVGVRIEFDPGNLGDGLADGAAFDAAGVDALWLEASADAELDPLALAAALSVMTFRAHLVMALPNTGMAAADRGRTLRTIQRLCNGRLVLVGDAEQLGEDVAGLALGAAVLRRVPGEPPAFEDQRTDGGMGRWISIPVSSGRASWAAARVEAVQQGASGLVVPADPRLLDMLRNPDDPEDRPDLHLAQG